MALYYWVCVTLFISMSRGDFVHQLFDQADQNYDGLISPGELDYIFQAFDKNEDGKVTDMEFIPIWMEVTTQDKRNSLALFNVLDASKDNVIRRDDLTALYSLLDEDHNGMISGDEFEVQWTGVLNEIPFVILFSFGDADKDKNLTPAEMFEMYLLFDINNDRIVSEQELMGEWQDANFGDKKMATLLFTTTDVNGDGYIENDPDITKTFKSFDRDRDGRVSQKEFVYTCKLLNKNELQLPGYKPIEALRAQNSPTFA